MRYRKWSSKDNLTIVLEGLKGQVPVRSQKSIEPEIKLIRGL